MEEGFERPEIVRDYVGWGAGPRASEYLILAARAHALLHGEHFVRPEDVRAVAHPVLRHRVLTNFNAEADQVGTDQIIDTLLDWAPVESNEAEAAGIGRVMRG
ncbi:MAG: hypothetical protein AAFU70_09485, partial [Planctomycetota bacterium]